MDSLTSITLLSGVGNARAKKLAQMGLKTVGDLVTNWPRKYADFQNATPIRDLRVGDEVTINAQVVSVGSRAGFYRRISVVTAILEDESGPIKAIWFNQPYIKTTLKTSQKYIFVGKVAFDRKFGGIQLQNPHFETEAKIAAIYSERPGISSKYLRFLVGQVLGKIPPADDYLPRDIVVEYRLLSEPETIEKIHEPASWQDVRRSRERVAFNELFAIIASQLYLKSQRKQELLAPKCPIDEALLKKFVAGLPFKLTDDQRKAAWQIVKDLSHSSPMNRLLQGDVGSGKTVVGLVAALSVIRAGYKVVWMAPTALLAGQHFQTAQKLLRGFGVKVDLWTAHRKTAPKIAWQFHLSSTQLLIGTHALLYGDLPLSGIGLAIIDEQHRFGVAQRARLAAVEHEQLVPHFFSMTATPIPRTLAHAIYGNLDVSTISQKPAHQKPIISKIVPLGERPVAYQFVASQIKAGRQIFVICPLIAPTDSAKTLFDLDQKTVELEYAKLSQSVFPKLKIGKLHGKMKAKEKDQILADFAAQKFNLLVSTSVIEVGIDIPNATVMLIEGAERFGLSQLHQFRGRIGRGQHQSYCFLMVDYELEPSSNLKKRLQAFVSTNDGFKLAELDLKLRGPGDLLGELQSGFLELKVALLTDTIIIGRVKTIAEKLVADLDKYPGVKNRIENFIKTRHLE